MGVPEKKGGLLFVTQEQPTGGLTDSFVGLDGDGGVALHPCSHYAHILVICRGSNVSELGPTAVSYGISGVTKIRNKMQYTLILNGIE